MNRLMLAGKIIARFFTVHRFLRSRPLPDVVDAVTGLRQVTEPQDPRRLRYGVDRLLNHPGRSFRCLPRALVLYSLLADQGEDARLLVGLPINPSSTEAHAWVEISGVDVGPSPGRGENEPIASYPL